ncbi:MAG: translocation/assembly module TamB domain-containing protein [Spirochaetaceae bacterium]|jgi:hypothetical protein|nr:translocation/assembly module TamB domain-containing protein [Spirochaetaceae bacterium]
MPEVKCSKLVFLNFLIFPVLIIGTALLLRPVQKTFLRNFEVLKSFYLQKAQNLLNKHISYDSIEPSIFSTLDIKNISAKQIEENSGHKIPDISAERICIKYNFLELIGVSPFKSLHDIKIVCPVVEFETGKELADFAGSLKNTDAEKQSIHDIIQSNAKEILGIFPSGIKLRITQGELSFISGASNAYISSLFARIDITDGTVNLNMSWDSGALLEGITKTPFKIDFPCKLDAYYNIDEGTGKVNAALASVRSQNFTLQNINTSLELLNDSLFVQIVQQQNNLYPFDLEFDYNFSKEEINSSVHFDKFSPSSIVKWQEKLAVINNFQKINLNGEIELQSNKEEGLLYRANLNGICERQSIQGAGNFAITASGSKDILRLQRAVLALEERGTANISGTLNLKTMSPNGNISLDHFLVSKVKDGSPISGDVLVSSSQTATTIFSETLTFGETQLSAFDAELHNLPESIDINLSALCFTNTESYSDVGVSRINADISYGKDKKDYQLMLALESFTVADIMEIASAFSVKPTDSPLVKAAQNNIMMTTEIFATYDYEHLVYNVPRFITALRSTRNVWASSSISGTEEFFAINDGKFVNKGSILNYDARADFESFNHIQFVANINWMNSNYQVFAEILDKAAVNISSPQGLHSNFTIGSGGQFSGYLMLDSLQIPLGKQVLAVNADSEFRYDSPNSWHISMDKLTCETSSSAFSTIASADFVAYADQDGANISRISFNDVRGQFYGSADFEWSRVAEENGGVKYTNVNGRGNLHGDSGTEKLEFDLHNDKNSFFVWANAQDFQCGRIFDSSNFLLSGELGFFQNSDEEWSCAFDLYSLSGQMGGSEVVVNTRGSLDSRRLEIGETSIVFANIDAEMPYISLALDQHTIKTSASIVGVPGSGTELNADLSVDIDFQPIDSWFGIANVLNSVSGKLSFENVRFDTVDLRDPFTIEFTRFANILSVTGGPQNMMRIQLDSSGDFFAAFSTPSPVKGTIVGTIKNNMLDLHTSNFMINMETLWRYLPVRAVSFTGGIVMADLQIKGPIYDPDFFGTVSATSLRVNLPKFIDGEIGPASAYMMLDGNLVTLQPFYTKIGNGACNAEGSFLFDRWLPRNFNLGLTVSNDLPVPINLNISGFLAKGTAFGSFNLQKDEAALRITGDVFCEEAELTMDFDDSTKTDKKKYGKLTESIPIQVELDISSGNKVEFLWPNTKLPIIRANAAYGSKLSIVSDKTTNHFSLKGNIEIRSGEIFYFQRSFYIREGNLTFNESEVNFDPHITARAEARDMTNNEQVTISMVIDDQSLIGFTPRLEANPPLSQVEILSLMGEKLTGSHDENNTIANAFVSSTADIIAQFYVVSQIEKSIRNLAHLDMFSVRTQALQNAILLNLPSSNGTKTTETPSSASSDTTVETGSTIGVTRIGNYFDNTTVYIGKYIGTSLFAQVMLALRYDKNSLDWGGLRFEPDFSMEFKAPVFDIKWELFAQHPETLWIVDNKITVSKKWTLP